MNRITTPRGESLKIIVPSQTLIGSPFTATIIAFLPNGRTNWHYDGTLQVTTEDPSAKGTGEVHAIPVSGGAFKHTMTFATPGIHHISIRDTDRGLEARSNPINVQTGSSELNLYWGDLHNHCGERNHHQGISDAYAPLDYNYHFGRHVAALDFMALSDHDQLGNWRPSIIPIWDRFKKAAEYFYRPGEFVTLLGWEWTNGTNLCPGRPQYGQKCIYFRDGEGPIFSSNDPGSDTPEKLYDRLRAHRCFIIPHHVSAPDNFYNNWDHHDPGLERLVEIYSVWGCGERPAREGNPYPIRADNGGDRDGHHVKDALARSYTLGFTAGGDTHDAAPGGIGHTYNGLTGQFENRRWAKSSPHHPGIQGVWAEELTREAIFEAIFNRHTYGTTGARIILKTELNSRPMGTVFPLRPNAPLIYKVSATGTATITKMEVVRNGETIHEVTPNEDQSEFTFEDTDPPSGQIHYYLRLTQQDGHMAWASPHFLPGGRSKSWQIP
ncbi:MAG: DUF3604 domain-containing protein [Candidatus Latescibacteria bacterium]|jgi:hypothetical protein|nr:DUF3604 domain-containing protein [Candidatus Latescibacterota bacterium]